MSVNNCLVFLPSSIFQAVEPDLSKLGEDVLSDAIFDYITDAERNLPYLRGNGRDAFGKPRSELVVTEGWRKLQDFGIEKGYVIDPLTMVPIWDTGLYAIVLLL